MHHRKALLGVEAVEQSIGVRLCIGRVHTHVGPNLPPPADDSARAVTPLDLKPRLVCACGCWSSAAISESPFLRDIFAQARPLVAHSFRAQRAAPIFLRVPTSGARGLAAIAEPRGPLPDSGLVCCEA
ncbi:hypothetical protein MLAC_32090 [Mycobacterium lacus]|uniref:Uncharacterized protein n=1 Tax=Mycobacterium lacus TaxID=169765 RepID=A0A7I7NMP4_9MYCO|nr:hypothetical protein MLAC_32090 [Mycobacterium lacus]